VLQAHSLLWHYLWVAPSVLLLILAIFLFKKRLHSQYPVFFVFAVASSVTELAVYTSDVVSWVQPRTFWIVFWCGLLIEGILKFVLIGEIFAHVFDAYASIARLGRILIRAAGVILILLAAVLAGSAPKDTPFAIISGAHLLEQTVYLIESGLLVFIFLFSAYFRLHASRPVFGIALGLGISACVHLATWALLANGGLPTSNRIILDFVNMATYHGCVLIWFYYLLLPPKVAKKSAVSLPEHNLELWNRELERFLQP